MKLSVVILTNNEESTIERSIKSALFADEIFIIDNFSTDRTLSIVKKYNARVIKRALKNNFAFQRNFGLKNAKGDWIFFLDADEEISEELREEIIKKINKKSNCSSYYIKRRDYFWGRELKYGELWNAYRTGLIRLIKKNSGFWSGSVHESFNTDKLTGRLKSFINHHSHENLKEFLSVINVYSSIRANELLQNGVKTNILQIIFYPLLKFKLNYIFKLGFLDGVEGFVYCFIMSFHSFLVRAKLYQYLKIKS